jgi:uncharacterized protein (UPF0297 family)
MSYDKNDSDKDTSVSRRKVLSRVNKAISRGYSATRVGYFAVGDPLFVPKLLDGHNFRPSTLRRALLTLDVLNSSRVASLLTHQDEQRPVSVLE